MKFSSTYLALPHLVGENLNTKFTSTHQGSNIEKLPCFSVESVVFFVSQMVFPIKTVEPKLIISFVNYKKDRDFILIDLAPGT